MIVVEATIDPGSLAYELAGEMSESEIIDFIMDIHANVSDYEFTKSLVERLSEHLRIYEGD